MKKLLKFIRSNPVPFLLLVPIVLVQAYRQIWQVASWDTMVLLLNVILFSLFALSVVFPRNQYYSLFRNSASVIVVASVAAVLVGMFVDPKAVDLFAHEDNPVENLSAIICFVAAVIWLGYVIYQALHRNWRIVAVSVVFVLATFLIGAEEISWGQRILDVESSEFFIENNWQKETNLHNLNTFLSEKIFYSVGILALVIVPFFSEYLHKMFRRWKLDWLRPYIPSFWMAAPFAVIVGLAGGHNKLTWAPVLMASAFALAILIFLLVEQLRKRKLLLASWYTFLILLQLLVALTFRFFDYQSEGVRGHVGSEYLELFIELGLLVYTVDFMFRNTKLLGGKSIR